MERTCKPNTLTDPQQERFTPKGAQKLGTPARGRGVKGPTPTLQAQVWFLELPIHPLEDPRPEEAPRGLGQGGRLQ